MLKSDEQISLGPFQVDLATTRLLREGMELGIRPRAFRALKLLVQNPGRLVGYQQFIQEAWDGTNISRHTIAVTISELKDALSEYGSWITCNPKFGYTLEVPRSESLIRRGWHYWNQCTLEGYQNALKCFQEATAADGADFRAFAGISSTYLMLAGFLMLAPRDVRGPFWEAYLKAEALCGPTPELRLDRAFAQYVFERNVREAESELLAMQPERPNSAHLYVHLALICLGTGRIDEARKRLAQAQAADSLSPELSFLGIVVHLFAGEFDAAVDWGRDTLDLHPGSQVGRAFYAEALAYAGREDEAFEQYRLASALSPDILWIRADQARCLATYGRREEAVSILEDLQQLRKSHYVDAYHVALLVDALGDREEALRELERAWEENSYALFFSGMDVKAKDLRSDPRFEALQEKTTAVAC